MVNMTVATEERKKYRLWEWVQMVQVCQSSGLSKREFCRQNGISEKTCCYRLRQMRKSVIAHSEQTGTLVRLEEASSRSAGIGWNSMTKLSLHSRRLLRHNGKPY